MTLAPLHRASLTRGRSKPHASIRLPWHGELKQEPVYDSFDDVPYSFRTFRPGCLMLIGDRGSGKTHTMTTMGFHMGNWYEQEGDQRKVYSNYINLLADHCDPELVFKATSPYGSPIRNGIMLIDEFQEVALARRSISRINIDIAQALTQIRKRNLECVFTTQNAGAIDKLALWQIDTFIQVRQVFYKFGPGRNDWDVDLLFAYHDWKNHFTYERKKRYFPPMWAEADDFYHWAHCRWAFDFYFDDETITSGYIKDPDVRKLVDSREWERFGIRPDMWEGDIADLGGTDIQRAYVDPNDPDAVGRPSMEALEPSDKKVAAPSARGFVEQEPTGFVVKDMYRWLRNNGYLRDKSTAEDFERDLRNWGFDTDGDGVAVKR